MLAAEILKYSPPPAPPNRAASLGQRCILLCNERFKPRGGGLMEGEGERSYTREMMESWDARWVLQDLHPKILSELR